MNIKKMTVAALAATTTASLAAAVPQVGNDVTMTQSSGGRTVTITYTLSDAPAVVTLEVQTNANTSAGADDPGWTSIGGAAVSNAKGDVWKRVETGSRTITWRPDLSWPDHIVPNGGARAVVTAWALDNTPDYMVADISSAAQPNTQTYYPAADFVPGGVSNSLYKTTTLIMRKIMAKDVKWTMGSTTLETQRTAAREATHQVTLTNNYYIGVYQVTQAQWALLQPSRSAPSGFNNATDRAMRPVENVCYNEIRNSEYAASPDPAYNWPANPNPSSFLGQLRSKTGLDFDLPSEAQWEFAARAGNGDTKWGNDSGIMNTEKDVNLDLFGRYERNGGRVHGGGTTYSDPDMSCGAANATAIVGSYAPNAWGLYDTSGNLWEWCLDWMEDNITANEGKINIDPSAPAKTLSGASGGNRVLRGGSWYNAAGGCRPAMRSANAPNTRNIYSGFRVLCYAGLR